MSNGFYPPEFDTARGQVRALIPDVEVDADENDEYLFSDDHLDVFLALSDDDPRLAAAKALDVLASNEVLLYRYMRTDDLQVDGSKGASVLLARAAQLRAEASNDGFDLTYATGGYVHAEGTPFWGNDYGYGYYS